MQNPDPNHERNETPTLLSIDCLDLLSVLGDPCARTILIASVDEPVTVSTLVEVCEKSRPTIYRRINDLREHQLLEKTTTSDSDSQPRYKATFCELTIEIHASGVEIGVKSNASAFSDQMLYHES